MNPALSQPAPALAAAFDAIIAGLCQVMARECGINRFIAPICVLLSARLLGTVGRFEVLFVRWRAAHLPPARPHHPKLAAAATGPRPTLPRAFGWLLKIVPTADVFGTMLQHLLTAPEMVAFLTEAPQAGRLLRPLCHTLGVKPIPQLLRPKNPKPAPEAVTPEKPPTAETTTIKAPPEIAKNPDSAHADDPLWVRPVSLWCKPPRPRT